MDHKIASLLLIFTTDFFSESKPIKSGFSVKFKPLFTKEEVHPKTFGALFAKVSQEFTPEAILRRQLFAKAFKPPAPELGIGCSNQVARMMYPLKYPDNSSRSDVWDGDNFINLPIIQQPYKDYKILVVTAPPHIKMGRKWEENKKFVIYVVFPEDSTNTTPTTTTTTEDTENAITLPEVYFVNKPTGTGLQEAISEVEKRSTYTPDPLIFINSNRTLTGLKSKQVEKFITFTNSLLKRYNYELTP